MSTKLPPSRLAPVGEAHPDAALLDHAERAGAHLHDPRLREPVKRIGCWELRDVPRTRCGAWWLERGMWSVLAVHAGSGATLLGVVAPAGPRLIELGLASTRWALRGPVDLVGRLVDAAIDVPDGDRLARLIHVVWQRDVARLARHHAVGAQLHEGRRRAS